MINDAHITPEEVRAARLLLGWSEDDLVGYIRVTATTISGFELPEPEPSIDLAAARAALESAGVEFIGETGGGAGVRLRKKV